ncbi:hypothetical protein MWU78_16090 [Arenibacter sp. F26102]|uniref:hypothetical protein n=1 Tax=Arenibacter sp. F26102 TaxID=2926416 RepID=UPI001FF61D2E|nr:hypothetical protein [Arenibacter sp. F26102]MCK0147179.1 hypothetical protein [Arenibacter sp. F26102]
MSIFIKSQNLSDFAFEIIKKKEKLKLLLGAHSKGQCLSPPALLIAQTVAKHFGSSRKVHSLPQILFIKTRTHPGCNTQAQMDFSSVRRATEGFTKPSYSDALKAQAVRQLLLGRKKKNDLATKPMK